MFFILIFIYGITFGSFYNVVGLRVPLNQSIVKPRSHCPNCNHTLTAIDLIPVLSYLFLRGKCRRCKAPISPFYPIIELITGILFMMAPILMGWSFEIIIAWTLVSLMVIIFVSDIHYMIIPDKVLLVFSVIFLIERCFLPLSPWWDSALGAVVGFSLLLLIAVVSKGGMGGGDIKLFAVIGFALGTKLVLISFFLATFFGAFFGVIGMMTGKVKKRKPIPFGPFIAIGTIAAYFFGENIIQWYIHFM
ncbi:prepilin peptidase [Neobacillus sp. MM2021_6]|uniref:prepilin peptidase n=1 Tax=Bacillaceae TaxID=186817 RepID=UPI00140E068D|nr:MULTISPECIES: A24 family peptidase [Bacillaceae]MBO0960713.1 prepilin peptidase [Neobacillus sp. MM2021_6]NHC17365.1 prepilin peptidase [Bacillus sp. MM2020_4]